MRGSYDELELAAAGRGGRQLCAPGTEVGGDGGRRRGRRSVGTEVAGGDGGRWGQRSPAGTEVSGDGGRRRGRRSRAESAVWGRGSKYATAAISLQDAWCEKVSFRYPSCDEKNGGRFVLVSCHSAHRKDGASSTVIDAES